MWQVLDIFPDVIPLAGDSEVEATRPITFTKYRKYKRPWPGNSQGFEWGEKEAMLLSIGIVQTVRGGEWITFYCKVTS